MMGNSEKDGSMDGVLNQQ